MTNSKQPKGHLAAPIADAPCGGEAVERDALRYRWLRRNMAETPLRPAAYGAAEFNDTRLRYQLPVLVSWADYCGQITLDEAIDAALSAQMPSPPAECQTDAERTAFAFGWWKAQETASAERDELRALWLEWESGMYDGGDLLRRVRLALHRNDGLRAVSA